MGYNSLEEGLRILNLLTFYRPEAVQLI